MFQRMGLLSRKQVFKPLLTRLHQKRRLLFARKFRSWTAANWQKVVFFDEKVFRVRPGGFVRRWVPKSASKFDARYTGAAVSKPQGLMVWAAINGKGALIRKRCPPKVKSRDYQDILDGSMRLWFYEIHQD